LGTKTFTWPTIQSCTYSRFTNSRSVAQTIWYWMISSFTSWKWCGRKQLWPIR